MWAPPDATVNRQSRCWREPSAKTATLGESCTTPGPVRLPPAHRCPVAAWSVQIGSEFALVGTISQADMVVRSLQRWEPGMPGYPSMSGPPKFTEIESVAGAAPQAACPRTTSPLRGWFFFRILRINRELADYNLLNSPPSPDVVPPCPARAVAQQQPSNSASCTSTARQRGPIDCDVPLVGGWASHKLRSDI
ncbi:hypothetical protein BD414DRAFT_324565 [Trametes punicea]|nr:hypothetical protein BD414DRAFT_324565 [Trametes punicea]